MPVLGYIGVVVALAVGLLAFLIGRYGVFPNWEFAVFAVLAVGQLLAGDVVVERRVVLSFSSIVLLAGQAILGPAGAGLLGLGMGAFEGRSVPLRARVFNAAEVAIFSGLGGLAFLVAGGTADPAQLQDTSDIVFRLALPLLLADIVQFLANVLLLAGVVRVAQGVPVSVQVRTLVGSTGAAYIGYGIIAFLLVVLWRPAELGPVAVLLVLGPLLVAQWAYRQHAEELTGQGRALQVLVAAVEAKAPHLTGHSTRVAELSGHMAQHLGLRPQMVSDTRVAGMLHDLGQTSLPTALVRSGDPAADSFSTYPARGADLLRGLSFLSGALPAIEGHHTALDADDRPALPARIVGVADAYDLLTEVGTPDGLVLRRDEAIEVLRGRPHVDAELVQALEASLARRIEEVSR